MIKKKKFMIMLFILIIFLASCDTSGNKTTIDHLVCGEGLYENNGECVSNEITVSIPRLTEGTMIYGEFDGNDTDIYEIRITESSTYNIFTYDIELDGYLYDEYNTLIAYNNDTDFIDFYLSVDLEPGIYYINLEADPFSAIGSYRLIYNRNNMDNLFLDLGANPIVSGNLEPDEYIMYELNIPPWSVITIKCESEFDSVGKLYDENGYLIGSADDNLGNYDFGMTGLLAQDRYFLKIEGYDSYDYGTFTITIEYGDTLESVYTYEKELEVDSYVQRNLMSMSLRDLYGRDIMDEAIEFQVLESGYYTIYLSSDFDSYGILYDAEGTIIIEDDDSGENYNFGFEVYLDPGSYSILIKGNESSDYGDYIVYVDSGKTLNRDDVEK